MSDTDRPTRPKALPTESSIRPLPRRPQQQGQAERRTEALAALVPPELAALLEQLATRAEHVVYEYDDLSLRAEREPIAQDMRKARALAAKIREVLDDSQA